MVRVVEEDTMEVEGEQAVVDFVTVVAVDRLILLIV